MSSAIARMKVSTCLAMLMAAIGAVVGWLLTRNLLAARGAELSESVVRVADGDLSQPLRVSPHDNTSVLANVARMRMFTRTASSLQAHLSSIKSSARHPVSPTPSHWRNPTI